MEEASKGIQVLNNDIVEGKKYTNKIKDYLKNLEICTEKLSKTSLDINNNSQVFIKNTLNLKFIIKKI